MFLRRFSAGILSLAVLLALVVSASANTAGSDKDRQRKDTVATPINLAILIQDDLISQVDNELSQTKDFIRGLPQGSRVMVAYITSGSLQIRQPFTTDLNQAAGSLRILRSSTSASPFNPYVEVIEGLREFDNLNGRKAMLLISDGLDTSRGFDATAAGNTLDLRRAIDKANEREVAVYTFYAPSVGFTSRNRLAASYGQSSLNRLAKETGGKAFFQGTSGFVSFDSYFRRLSEALNDQFAKAS
jgi:hypothetical protein